MSSPPQRAGWWRFPAPSVLVFTLLMGAFPWIEVGCEGKPQDFEAMNQPNPLTGQKPPRPVGQNGKVVLATQNGYQAIWGGSSPGPEIRELQKEAEKQAQDVAKKFGGALPPKGGQPPPNAPKNPDDPGAAPLLAVYFFLVIAAIAVGFAMPPGHGRSLAFLGTAGLAVLLFGIQAAVGLPLKKKAEQDKAGAVKVQGAEGFNVHMPNLGGPTPYCRYTPWYYLNWPFLLIPLGLAGAEEMIGLLSGGGKPRRKRRYDDENDDRPRRRRYVDEDDEDEDRPRKRSRARDEDDDDEPPPRRRRYDDEDDEDDERPRGRGRRD